MGIKGIYAQLGSGQRVSLAKLTADSFKENGRPLRLAVDFAIWQFQAQAARGGTNPAIRTLFYRLVRLMGTPVEPIFVFDGPHKPVFKRNKRSGRGDGVAVSQAKNLIRLLGFPVHDAPAEAEAECALMQKKGIVDAVLSEDVDTIMFGCTRTLRNWSAEGKSNKTPTHVSLYDVNDMNLAGKGLDREGMVLVALMSGGDYLPDGIPGCGVKVACEAAKAGFGTSLCRLKASDTEGIRAWRERLVHELRTNESNYFRVKHKALDIPETFPNTDVLGYYTHPVVSPESVMQTAGEKIGQRPTINLDALREFARETFGWDFKIGAIKFIRVLGAAILVRSMLHGEVAEGTIQRIANRRTHFSTDGETELRLSYIPADVVPIDLSQETEEVIQTSRDGLALNSGDEFDGPGNDADAVASSQAQIFDPEIPDLAWVLEEVVRQTVPGHHAEWEEAQRNKAVRKSPTKKKTATTKGSKGSKATGMKPGAMDKFVRVTKTSTILKEAQVTASKSDNPTPRELPVVKPAQPVPIPSSPPRESSKPPTPSGTNDPESPPAGTWTSASSHMTPSRTPRAAGIVQEAILISSSPVHAASSPPTSPSPRPRAPAARSEEVSGTVRSGSSPSKISKGMRARLEKTMKSTTKDSRYKQTSMDMFTTRSDPFFVSRPGSSMDLPALSTSADSDIDDDLPPLSSMMSAPSPEPLSPSKRHKSPDLGRHASPSRPGKKKLLVPRTSAVGYFKEVEVEEEERDERASRESKRLNGKGRVVRYSDVSFVDLTED